MLNIPVWKEWIQNLRSGKYQQINGKTTDDNGGRCGLGVLFHPEIPISSSSLFRDYTLILLSLGLSVKKSQDLANQVVSMNDYYGYSLPMIADYLEKYMAM